MEVRIWVLPDGKERDWANRLTKKVLLKRVDAIYTKNIEKTRSFEKIDRFKEKKKTRVFAFEVRYLITKEGRKEQTTIYRQNVEPKIENLKRLMGQGWE